MPLVACLDYPAKNTCVGFLILPRLGARLYSMTASRHERSFLAMGFDSERNLRMTEYDFILDSRKAADRSYGLCWLRVRGWSSRAGSADAPGSGYFAVRGNARQDGSRICSFFSAPAQIQFRMP